MTIHIVSDYDGIVLGAYSDINIVYEAVRNYFRKWNFEDEIEIFNESLLKNGVSALHDVGFYIKTLTLDDDFDTI